MRLLFSCTLLILLSCFATTCFAQTLVHAHHSVTAPLIDGNGDDPLWQQCPAVTVHDNVADIDIELRAAYDAERIYLLASFPDATEDRLHRALVWNQELNSYHNGPSREDVLVIKWNMSGHDNDLSLKSDRPYRADIWFWKANRTDHAGYADDKMQFYTSTRSKKSQQLISRSGKVFYLRRIGDSGDAAYKPHLPLTYAGDQLDKYELVTPTGSRADIRAKGQWRDGRWTIEFSRALATGHGDDLQLDPAGHYLFGVSRYEIAARQPEPGSEQPLYGSGDIGQLLTLVFDPAETP